MRNNPETTQPKRRSTNRRTFEIDVNRNVEHHLKYFINQELGYFNVLVEKLTPPLRAFPQVFMGLKDKERKIWEICAENAVDPQKLLDHPTEQWPEHLRTFASSIREPDGSPKISPAQITIMKIAAEPARLHKSVRRAMALEILKYMINQADTLHAGMKTEGLRSPTQLLHTQSLDTKRHLQIPGDLIKVSFDQETNSSMVSIPYTVDPLRINGFDISDITFKSAIIRAPHPINGDGKWYIDFKDTGGYSVTLSDHNERKRR
jgi:hypothetical protein